MRRSKDLKRRRKTKLRISFDRFFRWTIKLYSKTLMENFTRPSIFSFFVNPYLGKTGPKRFSGTPQEVAEKFRKWQRTH